MLAPQFMQKRACGGLSSWHRGHGTAALPPAGRSRQYAQTSPVRRNRSRTPDRAGQIAPRARSVLLVMQELRVDRQHAPLALLLELHHAVDRGEDAVTEQLLA